MERVLVSRQPIYRADLSELGYELLFRNSDDDFASLSDGDQATADVLVNTFMELGLDEIVGRHLAFINFDRNLILGNYVECLPRERVVAEVLKTIKPDAALVRKLYDLRTMGYRIAVDGSVCTNPCYSLLDVANFVKFDLLAADGASLESSVRAVRRYPVQLIAEKVETDEQVKFCRELGFDYFQGYFFCRPRLMEGRRLPVSRLATIRLIAKLNNPDVEVTELELAISQDVSLTYKLLRFINSVIFSLQRTVTSIRHAITLLGQEQIRQWASLILFSAFEGKSWETLVTGAVRARMCEHLGKALGLPNPERLFLVGLFSVLESILGQPMQQIVASLPLSSEIVDALVDQRGKLGAVLCCVLEYERRNWGRARAAVNIDEKTIGEAYRKSVRWTLSTLNCFSSNRDVHVAS
jgi:c-di-GMP phosphodiesterase